MKGFVLAAGLGTRLHPVTEAIPKPLLPVGNVPLIGYALKLLSHHGITDAVVNLHHQPKLIREALGDGSLFGVRITYSEEEEILGTGGAIRRMQEFLDETFVLINGDTVFDVALDDVLRAHRDTGALATLVLRSDPNQSDYGQISIDDTKRIRAILGHSREGDEATDLRSFMFAGVHVIEPRLLEYIPPDEETCIVRYAYTKALDNDEPLYGFESDGYWADAGTPERYLQVNADALDKTCKPHHVDPLGGYALTPKKEVAEVVRMGNDVSLGANVNIRPPVVIGDNSKIGDNSSIGPYAVIGEGVQVGKEASVSHSIVLAGAKIESGASLDKQVVSKKAKLSFGEEQDESDATND